MSNLDEIIFYGLLGLAILAPVNVLAWLFWPRSVEEDPMAEPNGDVPWRGER